MSGQEQKSQVEVPINRRISTGMDESQLKYLNDYFETASKKESCVQLDQRIFNVEKEGWLDRKLVMTCNGIGTKIKFAQETDDFTTIGLDLVALTANSLLSQGAQPLFYFSHVLFPSFEFKQTTKGIIDGIIQGCKDSGMTLLGADIAELPSMLSSYDLVGFGIGVAQWDLMLTDKSNICVGDAIVGLSSSGLHTSGHWLVREFMDTLDEWDYDAPAPFNPDQRFGKELLTVTKNYTKAMLPIIRENLIKAFGPIADGGLVGGIRQILPDHLRAKINTTWDIPPLFAWLALHQCIPIEEYEMLNVFNCGLGAVLIVDSLQLPNVLKILQANGEKAYVVGSVVENSGNTGNDRVRINNFYKKIKNKLVKYATSCSHNIEHKRPEVDLMREKTVVYEATLDLKSSIFKNCSLVFKCDSIGSKCELAKKTQVFDKIGTDLVALNVNNLLTHGARPMFFVHYYAGGSVLDSRVENEIDAKAKSFLSVVVMSGVLKACGEASCIPIGGSLCQMPDMYSVAFDAFYVAGIAIGLVDPDINKQLPRIGEIEEGDVVIGLNSSGLQLPTFQCLRTLLVNLKDDALKKDFIPESDTNRRILGEELMHPSEMYNSDIMQHFFKMQWIKAFIHIDWGGLMMSIPRFLPPNYGVTLDATKWVIPPIFGFLTEKLVERDDWAQVFNCGLGAVLITSPANWKLMLEYLLKTGKGTDLSQKTGEGMDLSQKTGEGTSLPQSTGEGTSLSQKKGTDLSQKTEEGSDLSIKAGEGTDLSLKAGEGTDFSQKTGEGTDLSQSIGEGASLSQSTEEGTSLSQKKGTELSLKAGEDTDLSLKAGEGTDLSLKAGEGTDLSQKTGEGTDLSQKTGEGTDLSQKTGEGTDLSQKTGEGTDLSQKNGEGTDLSLKTGEGTNLLQKTGKGTDLSQRIGEGTSLPQSTGEDTSLSQKKGTDLSQSTGEGTGLSQSTEEGTSLPQFTGEDNSLSQKKEECTDLSQSTGEGTDLSQKKEESELIKLLQNTEECMGFSQKIAEVFKIVEGTGTPQVGIINLVQVVDQHYGNFDHLVPLL